MSGFVHQVEMKLDRDAASERLRRIEAWCADWQISYHVLYPVGSRGTLRLAFDDDRLARAFTLHFGGVVVPIEDMNRALGADAEDAYDRLACEYDFEV